MQKRKTLFNALVNNKVFKTKDDAEKCFNELNIVVMNPETGTVYKKGMNDSKEWFEKNGNCFITYVTEER